MAVEKNIRRRLYDSLKVLVSIGAIRRTEKGKLLFWQGVSHLVPNRFWSVAHGPSVPQSDVINKCTKAIRKRLVVKRSNLLTMRQQITAMERLLRRNRGTPHVDEAEKIALPFVLIRTPQSTQINLDCTADAHTLSFDFSEDFVVVNDFSILDRIFLVGLGMRKPHFGMGCPGEQAQISTADGVRLPSDGCCDEGCYEGANLHCTLVGDESFGGAFPAQVPSVPGPSLRRPPCYPSEDAIAVGRSPKRRRVASYSPFPKYTYGDARAVSPSPSLINGPRGVKRYRRRGGQFGPGPDGNSEAMVYSPSASPPTMDARFAESMEVQDVGDDAYGGMMYGAYDLRIGSAKGGAKSGGNVRREIMFDDNRSAAGLRRGSGNGKRIYGPARDLFDDRMGSDDVKREAGVAGEMEDVEEADGIMLSPGFSPLAGLRCNT